MTDFLYCDRWLLVSAKPRGLLSEGDRADAFPTLLAKQLRETGENDSLFPVHRLDRETEGLMVWARTSDSAAALSASVAAKNVTKEYLAVICGESPEESGSLRDWIFYDRRIGKSFVTDRPRKGVKEGILDYRILGVRDGLSLVHIRLYTGRTHQIRVQFAARGLPLCGDRRYGAPASPYRMGLCSVRLAFPHPKSGENLKFVRLPDLSDGESRQNPWPLFARELEKFGREPF